MEYFLGVLVSALVQVFKVKWGLTSVKTLATVAAGSLAAAGAYTFLANTEYWPVVVTTATTAGAFYTFVISRFE